MKVPFLDLKVQYESLQDEIKDAIQQVLDRTAFAGGPFVKQFEEAFGGFCECESAIGVSSGTSALWLALLGLGVGSGDEVITVPNTFIATVEAISFCGATPVFVDIDEETHTMDPNLLEAAITPKTKAVIPVHLYGQMADMDPIMDIAKRHNLAVIEDSAQAHGAEYRGRRAGSIGDAGCFSFYPGKNLGAYGEAGAIVTSDEELAKKIRMLQDHGQSRKYHHDVIGWNGRMDGFQGAILNVKLKHIDGWNDARRKNANLYHKLLSDLDGVILPREADYAKHIYHVFSVRVKGRDRLMETLSEKNIHCGIHYPIPVHLTKAYEFLGLKKGSYPVAEEIAGELISLPMFPELDQDQINYVVLQMKQMIEK